MEVMPYHPAPAAVTARDLVANLPGVSPAAAATWRDGRRCCAASATI